LRSRVALASCARELRPRVALASCASELRESLSVHPCGCVECVGGLGFGGAHSEVSRGAMLWGFGCRSGGAMGSVAEAVADYAHPTRPPEVGYSLHHLHHYTIYTIHH